MKSIHHSLLATLVDNAKTLIDQGYYELKTSTANPYRFAEIENGFAILGEIKPASPSEGTMVLPHQITNLISEVGPMLDGISVLTEPNYFGGHLRTLECVIEYQKPTLMKDFILKSSQFLNRSDASAILLIARILSYETIQELIESIHDMGKEIILEVDNIKDFEVYIDSEADFLAINNRDLLTMEVDVKRTVTILQQFQPKRPIFGFSGYSRIEDIVNTYLAGARGILIGTALSRHTDNSRFLKSIKSRLEDCQ